ncbi:MAG: carbamoyltransferase [Alphaproteobacteria bacterium]
MRILGLSAFYHDSAAALSVDGRIVAAAQEERFTRIKHDEAFPRHAIAYCLRDGRVNLNDVDYVVFFEKPFIKFERLLETQLGSAPYGFASFRKAIPLWLRSKLFQKDILIRELQAIAPGALVANRLLFAEHHESHAAAAFYPSPFEEAVILTVDGVGEWATASLAVGRGNRIEMKREIRWPHSLGLFYSAFTAYCGFRVNSGEYKLMGLAPYGVPRYADLIRGHIIDVKPDGSFHLDLSYFNYVAGLTMTTRKFHDLFGGPPRQPESPLSQREMDLAASVQLVTEEVLLRMARDAASRFGIANICLGGGVALNCVANGKILRDGAFRDLWIQPAPGDAGSAIGAALIAYHRHAKQPRTPVCGDSMNGSYLGPAYSHEEIVTALDKAKARYTLIDDEASLLAETVFALEAGHAVGWFQGRMEFGPRALGARSILGDPRNPRMQAQLNLKIKYRESFRPFAPSVLAEDAARYFDLDQESPYMLLVAPVREERRRAPTSAEAGLKGIRRLAALRSDIPAVTHVDYSARVQTVGPQHNARYHALLRAFRDRTGCSVLVNTSFNIRGEPIVCSPADAFRCFMNCEMETLVIGNAILRKADQDPALKGDMRSLYNLD